MTRLLPQRYNTRPPDHDSIKNIPDFPFITSDRRRPFFTNGFLVYQIYNYELKWREEKNEDYRAKRNLYTWYFALAYILTMVDAYVDAYLYKFDDAMKISYHIDRQEEIWVSRL